MEMNTQELAVVQSTEEKADATQLTELQLTLAGGGCGEVVFA
jgi:hypothetical protein